MMLLNSEKLVKIKKRNDYGILFDEYFATTKEGLFSIKRESTVRGTFSYADRIKYNAGDNCVLVCWDMIKWDDTDPEFPEYIFVNALPILEKKTFRFTISG